MKSENLKTKSVPELKALLSELRRKQFKLRLIKASGEMKETHEIRETRRNVARVETILAEKEKVSS